MTSKIFTILFCLLGLTSIAQNPNYSFPEDWIGDYEGMMYIEHLTKGTVDSLPLTFELQPTDNKTVWTYIMTYTSPIYGTIVKDYLITKPVELGKNHYYLDEKDGILIDQMLIGNGFYSNFTVAGSIITSSLRNNGDHLFFELVSGNQENPTKSENITEGEYDDEGTEVYQVESFAPFTTQFAILYPKSK